MTSDEYTVGLKEIARRLTEIEKTNIEDESLYAAYIAEQSPRYYYISDCGEIASAEYCYHNGIGNKRLDIGNIFNTKSEAEFALERLRVIFEMQQWSGNMWDNYAIAYDKDLKNILISTRSFDAYYLGEMCFATRADAENCVEEVGAYRIKKYYFMIPEKEL